MRFKRNSARNSRLIHQARLPQQFDFTCLFVTLFLRHFMSV
jgi:hypothetical protein